jgi:choline-sulfatase
MPPSFQFGEHASRPNLLMLVADDHPAYLMGADGDTLVRTPNLDRLAGEGVRFTRNFCQSPVCSPSRQSMLTGQLPHSSGVTVLNTQMSTEKPTVAKQLRAAGYSTAVIGKMHWNCRPDPPHPGIYGFELPIADQNAWQMYRNSVAERAVEFRYFGARMPLPDGLPTKPHYRDFVDPTRIWMNADCIPEPGYERDLRGTFLVEKAIEFLKQPRDEPFALWLCFSEPHAPFAFPVEDLGLYRADEFQHPPVGPNDWESVSLVFRELDDDDHRGIAAACYTSVQFLDRNIGRILRALHHLGHDENTLVVYTSDHGTLLGHHGRVEKHCLFDEAIRTPLLMHFPGRFAGGRVISTLTESVDIPGTVLELLSAEPLPVDHGRSLVPLLEGSAHTHRNEIFSEYLENEEAGLRTERWKFWYCSGKRHRLDGLETDNPTPGRYVRLFDLEADPGEFDNLSADPSSAPIIVEMKQHLLARFLATHPDVADLPDGLALEDQLDWFLRPRDGHTSGKGPRAFKYGVEPALSLATSSTARTLTALEFQTQLKGDPYEC